MPEEKPALVVSRSGVVRGLWYFVACFLIADEGLRLAGYAAGHPVVPGLVRLFDIDGELTAPAFFSACLHLGAAILLAAIGRTVPTALARSWNVLAVGFVYLAFDEAASIHEVLMDPMRDVLTRVGLPALNFAWTVIGAPAAFVVALVFRRFIVSLDRTTRRRFILAGAVFLGGALGLESIGSAVYAGNQTVYRAVVTLEEGMEMAGMVIFIDALLRYLREQQPHIQVKLD